MIQDTFKSIAGGSCLALCLAKIVEPEGTKDSQLMMDVLLGWRKNFIEDDGFVHCPTYYMNLIDPSHREWIYQIINIKDLSEIPEGKVYPVLYSINGKDGHFVLANNKGIVWNPLNESKNVMEGKPISYRRIELDV